MKEAEGMAGEILFVEADFSDATTPAKVVQAAQDWQGGAPVAVLVNNVIDPLGLHMGPGIASMRGG